MLAASPQALTARYDLVMLDLDGVVYVGGSAVPGAAEAIAAVRERGVPVAFVTNNASRPPERVSDRLTALGVPTDAHDVVTSAQAAARLLRDRCGPGARIWTLGAEGLRRALEEEGLVPVGAPREGGAGGAEGGGADGSGAEGTGADGSGADGSGADGSGADGSGADGSGADGSGAAASEGDGAVALVTGYGPQVLWSDIMRAAVLIRDGLFWVASNADLTIPTPYGVAPGHGVQVRMLREFSGVDPVVAGKPDPPLLEETIRRVGGQRPLMVGDRLDTDIEGAHRLGLDSLLVMTGVTGVEELAAAAPEQRPTYISAGLDGLLVPHEAPVEDGTGFGLGGWTAQATEGTLVVSGRGSVDDWWRVVADAAWAVRDRDGRAVDVSDLRPPSGPRPGLPDSGGACG